MKVKKKIFAFLLLITIVSTLGMNRMNSKGNNITNSVDVSFSEKENFEENEIIIVSAKNFIRDNTDFVKAVILFKPRFKVFLEDVEILNTFRNLNGVSAMIPRTMFDYLSNSLYTSVMTIDDNNLGIAFDDDILDWGVNTVNADYVWGRSQGATNISSSHLATGDGTLVGLIDTGVDTDHVCLDDVYVGGWDFEYDDSDPTDTYGHGTAMAGIICAEDNEQHTIGVAPEINLYGLKTSLELTLTEILGALDWAMDPYNSTHTSICDPMQVLSMSWHFPGEGSDSNIKLLTEAFMRVYRNDIVLVTSMANGNSDSEEEVVLPANMTETISVGSIVPSDGHQGYYERWSMGPGLSGSNYGDWLDVVAPGGYFDIQTLSYTGGMTNTSATSAATAHVSGVVALMLEVNPDLTPGEVKWILKDCSRDDYIWNYDSYYHGAGIVDANEAVIHVQNYNAIDSDSDGLPNKQEITDGTDPYDSDSDNDGLTDYEEFYHSTYLLDATDSDTDGDGCPDGWEITHGFDPTVANGGADPDDDDLSNAAEYSNGTDPNDADSDDDLINDGDEVYWNLDPLDDSDADDDDDSDGLTNVEEINGWYDGNDDGDFDDAGEKTGWFVSYPDDSDSDDDTWNDYFEQHPRVGGPYDPLDPDDHPFGWP